MTPQAENWIAEMHGLDTEDTYRRALSVLFDRVDDLMWAGHDAQSWPDIEVFLESFDWSRKPSTTLVIGVLSSTCPVHSKLSSYPAFYARTKSYIETNWPERDIHGLLRGFEPEGEAA